MNYRKPENSDFRLLAEMNRQLIEDEGHTNPMSLGQLEARMRGWLAGGYRGVIFEEGGIPVAYVIYRPEPEMIYLRQFFVARTHRRRGIGRRAMGLLLDEICPRRRRVLVEVLADNAAGRAFWRGVGFRDYSITMELR